MNAKGWTLFAILIVVLGGIAAFFLLPRNEAEQPAPEPQTGNLEGQSIFASGEFGFVLTYPDSATVAYDFSSSYLLTDTWRANALPNASGTPVVVIVPYTTESETSYPRHYSAEVRVGVSDDKQEIDACEKVASDRGEEALPDIVIQGITWKAFSFGDAAMMKYVKGVSYRTVHDGKCYALEKLAIGSSYREEESASDIPEATLEAAYASLAAIVSTFSFIAP